MGKTKFFVRQGFSLLSGGFSDMIADKERAKKRDVKCDFRGILAIRQPQSLPLRLVFPIGE